MVAKGQATPNQSVNQRNQTIKKHYNIVWDVYKPPQDSTALYILMVILHLSDLMQSYKSDSFSPTNAF